MAEGDTPKLSRDYFRLFAGSTISNLGDGVAIIAYPWLASAVTRSGLLVALVVVAQRLPWLIFSLPAGVITDRVDRRRLMVGANVARAIIGGIVAVAVWASSDGLPSPDEIDLGTVASTDWMLYLLLIVATLLLGTAEVLYDNTAQTIMPSIVHADLLEKANGRLWSTEQVLNTLIGPVLGGGLLAIAFAAPFGIDALTFAVSAALIASMRVKSRPNEDIEHQRWQDDLKDGVRWLWRHEFLRPLAIILGLINMLSIMATATLVLYGQEVLGTSPTEFALMLTGGAAGGVIGGWFAADITERIGHGVSLWMTIVVGGLTMILSGLTSNWLVVWAMFAVMMFVGVLWNVITVSLRQTIIPDELLGRVNSCYRFFGWGMMPIGSLLGGVVVFVTEVFGDRELALRMPWIAAGVVHVVLIVYAGPRLTDRRIAEARASGTATAAVSPAGSGD